MATLRFLVTSNPLQAHKQKILMMYAFLFGSIIENCLDIVGFNILTIMVLQINPLVGDNVTIERARARLKGHVWVRLGQGVNNAGLGSQ